MISRVLGRVIAAQAAWARPLGDWNHRWLGAVFARVPAVKDLLNGTWLGHPAHASLTDIPVGSLALVLVFDVVGLATASDVALTIGVLGMLGAALSGSADYADTDGRARMVTTVHAVVMVVALIVLLAALLLRVAAADRALAVILDFAGFGILALGAVIGGDAVFRYGVQVDRHAFGPSGSADWKPLDVAEVPEGEPVGAKLGSEPLLLVRAGDTIHALSGRCAHANAPLAKGTLVDGCIECPWHGSRFDLATGHVRRGPAVYDQPRFEVRAAEGGGFEARRVRGPLG